MIRFPRLQGNYGRLNMTFSMDYLLLSIFIFQKEKNFWKFNYIGVGAGKI